MSTKQQKAASRWESIIRMECAALRLEKLAWVDKNWEAPAIPGTSRPREASKPDFSGFLVGGRHVVFEAKVTNSKTSFAFDLLAGHQSEHLADADAAGAASFVYVLDGDGRRWVIPWLNIALASKDRSSIAFNDGSELQQIGEWERKGAAFRWTGENWLETLQRQGEVSG